MSRRFAHSVNFKGLSIRDNHEMNGLVSRRIAAIAAICLVLFLVLGYSWRAVEKAPSETRILFLGNSHTEFNDVPNMVKNLLESDGTGRKVTVQYIPGDHLENVATPYVQAEIANGGWKFVVLQGAEISESHLRTYPQEGTIALAKWAKLAGARALYYSEWPRKGWEETDYIYNVYADDAKASGAEVVPAGHAWDIALKKNPKLDLWQPDGNHAKLPGSYLAACTFYYWIAGSAREPTWHPAEVDSNTNKLFLQSARAAVKAKRAS